MASRINPPRPIGLSPFAPVGKASPERTELWRANRAALVDSLLNVSKGKASRALARRYWPVLWEGEKLDPKRNADNRRLMQKKAQREAVERWLGIHGRLLQWRLELAGGWLLDNSERRIHQSEVRSLIKTWGEYNRKASSWLRKLAKQPENATRRKRASEYLKLLHDEGDYELTEQSLSDPAGTWEEYDRLAKETKCWLKEHDANGGVNLAAREVAELVAIFFVETRAAAMRTGDVATARRLNVQAARSNYGQNPANQYSHAVADALDAVGLPRQSWRHAAEAASLVYPDADLKSDETSGGV
jgi:hypothetical protein